MDIARMQPKLPRKMLMSVNIIAARATKIWGDGSICEARTFFAFFMAYL